MIKLEFKETNIGFIPENWETVPLTDLIDHYVDNRGKTAPTAESGIPLIATNCIKEQGLYPSYDKLRFVSKETYDNWFRDHPKPDDIIIVNKGTPGLVCLVPDPVDFCIAQDMIAIRADENKVYSKYLFAYMRTENFKYQVQNLNVGTTIPHLKKTVFKNLIIPLPLYEEQIPIGNLYFELSKKIELNQKMNQTLEEIGQAIFNHWFVHFEFPNEEGKLYKSSGGEMVDSELGEIPKDWEVLKVADVIELVYGKGLTKNKRNPGEVPVFGSNGITDYHNESFVKGPGLIIGRKGTVGKIHISYSDFWPIDTTYFVKSKIDSIMIFWYYLLNSLSLEKMNVHSAVPGLNRNDVYDILVLKPNINVLLDIESQLKSLFDKINQNNIENENLSQIRDSILPKLMSGKIRLGSEMFENR